MWRSMISLHAVLVAAVCGVEWKLNSRILDTEFDCFDYPAEVPYRTYEPGWALRKPPKYTISAIHTPKYIASPSPFNLISRRFDVFLSNREDIVKEHAKLVQDINGLKQVMHVPPIPDENRDYDDSIFHEIIEISTTSRPLTKSTKPPKTTKGFPVVLIGGNNRKASFRSPNLPPKTNKQTISLVGTSVTPLVKPHQYVMASSNRLPVRICMPFSNQSPKRRLSLWERILKSIIPRLYDEQNNLPVYQKQPERYDAINFVDYYELMEHRTIDQRSRTTVKTFVS